MLLLLRHTPCFDLKMEGVCLSQEKGACCVLRNDTWKRGDCFRSPLDKPVGDVVYYIAGDDYGTNNAEVDEVNE